METDVSTRVFPGRFAAFAFPVLALAVVTPGTAQAGADEPVFLVRGRPTLRDGGILVGARSDYRLVDADPANDVVSHTLSSYYGIHERLSVGTSILSSRKPRSDFEIDALSLHLQASLWRGEIEIGFEANLEGHFDGSEQAGKSFFHLWWEEGDWLVVGIAGVEAEREQEGDETELHLKTELELLVGYRPSLQSLVALELEWEGGEFIVHGVIAGFLGSGMFVGLAPKVGLSPSAPNLEIGVVLQWMGG